MGCMEAGPGSTGRETGPFCHMSLSSADWVGMEHANHPILAFPYIGDRAKKPLELPIFETALP